MALSPTVAQACSNGAGGHCYAELENYATFEATFSYMEIGNDYVPDIYHDNLNDEAWTIFADGSYVELGAKTGIFGYPYVQGYTSTPQWFTAYTTPSQSQTEVDYAGGPPLNSWFSLEESDRGNGVWCPFINGSQLDCHTGLPLYTSLQQSGLEVAANTLPTNNGQSYVWGRQLGTHAWVGWPSPFTFHTTDNQGNFCVFEVAPIDGIPGVAFATPNPNPSCLPPGQEQGASVRNAAFATLPSATLPAAPPAGPGSAGFATAQAGLLATSPAAGYQPTTAPMLNAAALSTIAQHAVTQANDPSAATTAVRVQTSLAKAMQTVDPTLVASPPATPGYARWLASPTSLIVMHGHFTLSASPRPSASPAPTGTVLEVVIDAQTGHVDVTHVGNQAGPITQLGTVQNLGGATQATERTKSR